MATDSLDSIKEENINNYYKNHINNIQNICNQITNSERKKECIEFKNSFLNVYISKGSDINLQIAKIPSQTDILYLLTDGISTRIDFTNLQSHMTVIISNHNFEENGFYTILKNTKKYIFQSKNNNLFSLSDNLSIKDSEPINSIEILGNMKSKVSHLTICSFRVKFIEDINCQNLFLRNSVFISRSSNFIEKISVEYLIEDYDSFSYNMDNVYDVKQYSIYYEYSDGDGLQSILLENNQYGTDLYIGGISTSFDYRSEIGLIFSASTIEISIEGNEFRKQNIINMTVFSDVLSFDLPSYQETKTLSISSSGTSEFSENAPSFHITYDKDQFLLDKTNLKIDLLEHQLFLYVPKVSSGNDSGNDNDESDNDDIFSSSIIHSTNGKFESSIENDDIDEGGENGNDDINNGKPGDDEPNNGDNDQSGGENPKKNKTGLIVGVVLGVVGAIAIIGVIVFFVIKRKRENSFTSTQGDSDIAI